MEDTVHAGGCLCGAVRYQIRGSGATLCFCHCASCRRASGATMVPWGTFARAGWHIARGALTEFRSSAAVLRGRCALCGTSLTYRHESRPGEIDVALATLDDPAPFAPQMHLWVADKLPWVVIGDRLPQYPRGLT